MQIEHETQVLDIDVEQIRTKLHKIKAKGGDRVLMRRWVYDLENKDDASKWIRLRQKGEKSAITYKEKRDSGVTGTSEIEVEVGDFEKASQIFEKIPGFKDKYYQENYRTQYILPQGEVNIDEWPQIPPILDIEAKDEKGVAEILRLLDLTGKDAGHIGHVEIYKRYSIDLHSIKELKFGE